MSERIRKQWTIDVTEQDIEDSKAGDSYNCMTARAVHRTIPDSTHIEVDLRTIRFSRGALRFIYLTPKQIQDYIVGFDAGDEIEPFRFNIRDPQIIQRRLRKPLGEGMTREEVEKEIKKAAKTRSPKKALPRHKNASGSGRTTGKRTYGMRGLRINKEK